MRNEHLAFQSVEEGGDALAGLPVRTRSEGAALQHGENQADDGGGPSVARSRSKPHVTVHTSWIVGERTFPVAASAAPTAPGGQPLQHHEAALAQVAQGLVALLVEPLAELLKAERPAPQPDGELMTQKEAARLVRCAPVTIRRWERRGRLRRSGMKGKSPLYAREEVLACIACEPIDDEVRGARLATPIRRAR